MFSFIKKTIQQKKFIKKARDKTAPFYYCNY